METVAATPTRRRVWLPRVGAVVVAVVALSMGVLAIVGDPAPARPSGVSPGDGAVVGQPPSQVALALTDGLRPQEFHLTVTTSTGAPVTTGAEALVGSSVVVPVSTEDGGNYLVGYHVRLADGTEESGVSRFQVRSTGAGGPGPGPNPTGSAGPDGDDASAHGAHFSDDPLSVTLAVVAALMVVALFVIMFRRPVITVPAAVTDHEDGQDQGEETTPDQDEVSRTSRH